MLGMKYWYIPEHHLVIIKIVGRPSSEQIIQFSIQITKDYNIDKEHITIQDNREAELDFKYDEITTIKNTLKKHITHPPKKTAILINSKLAFGISRMADAVFSDLEINHRPFTDFASAISWLELPADFKLPYEHDEMNKTQ